MGLFDILKKKKPMSQMSVEASKEFLKHTTEEDSSERDIMEKLKEIDINPKEADPRNVFGTPPLPDTTDHTAISYKPDKKGDIIQEVSTNNDMINSLPSPENVVEKIDSSLHSEEKATHNPISLEDLVYELRTIRSQNDLIIDLLRQIYRKINM